MTGLNVRTAGPNDADAVGELLFEFNGEALPPAVLARRMEQASGFEQAFLGEVDGATVGLLVLRIVPTISAAEDWAEITEMFVRPSFRRRAIGKALVRAALEQCRRRGCKEVHLLVDPENRPAHAFYGAMGFSRDSCEMRHTVWS